MSTNTKSIFFILLILYFSTYDVHYVQAQNTNTTEEILNDLNNIQNEFQESLNKLLIQTISKIASLAESLDSAFSNSSQDLCNESIKSVLIELPKLTSQLQKKKCKSTRRKAKCIPKNIIDEIVPILENTKSSLSEDANNNSIFDICEESAEPTPVPASSCLINDETDQNTNNATDNDTTITTCNSNTTITLNEILNSNKLVKSSSAKLDTKLELGDIELYKYPLTDGDILIAKNTSYIPIEVMVELSSDSKNVSSDLSKAITVPPKSQKFGFKVCISDASKVWNYNYTFNTMLGFSTNTHTGDGKYFLPFKEGESYTVVQGEMGTFSHFGEFLDSLDFGMPEGSDITAMRNGTVTFVKEDSNEGGPDRSFLDKANFIWVLHTDGSIGKYVHLKQNGALVNLGDKIKAGDVVGLSGNTGFTDGPHLHVQVLLEKGFGEREFIPIRFKGIDGALVEGESYTAGEICR